jgi:hypothetical protein
MNTRKLKILVKNGQISMKKSLKNGRFCQIFDEKRHCGVIQFAGLGCGIVKNVRAGFFLKHGEGGIPPRTQPY